MQSKTLELSRNSCIYGVLGLFKRNYINSEFDFDINTIEQKINFEKEVKTFWIRRSRHSDQPATIKGKINFDGNGYTKIDVKYKKNFLLFHYSLNIGVIIFFALLSFLISMTFFDLSIIIVLIIISCIMILPTLAIRYSFYNDEKNFADQIFSYLYVVDFSDLDLSDNDLYNLGIQEEHPISYKNNGFPKCLICRKSIIGEEIVFCPFCNAPYHKKEFLEWLKVKAHCKICKKELDMWEFQKHSEKHEHIEEISSIKCQKCKNLIPSDSRFCIFCGVKILDSI
ncbi:MAG: hypothetical protein ACFFDN_01915 [Candidatus Hodarchaeota archaeon]